MSTEYCIGCLVEICFLDNDPNGDKNPVCARCRAEEAHDLDRDPTAVFDRAGRWVEKE